MRKQFVRDCVCPLWGRYRQADRIGVFAQIELQKSAARLLLTNKIEHLRTCFERIGKLYREASSFRRTKMLPRQVADPGRPLREIVRTKRAGDGRKIATWLRRHFGSPAETLAVPHPHPIEAGMHGLRAIARRRSANTAVAITRSPAPTHQPKAAVPTSAQIKTAIPVAASGDAQQTPQASARTATAVPIFLLDVATCYSRPLYRLWV
jgi:hypothetical protein